MRILVCGSVDWDQKVPIVREMYKAGQGVNTLYHGAARGADTIAAQVAVDFGWQVLAFPAEWSRYRRAAGPIRNRQMLDCVGQTGIVLGFVTDWRTSRGTKDTILEARRCRIPVHLWTKEGVELDVSTL